MQNDKLLPCPFCNRRAELRYDKDGFSYIVCANDGCYVRTDGHLNEESAIKHWNTRKPMERIVERLEEKIELHKKQSIDERLEASEQFVQVRQKNCFVNALKIVKEEGGIE